METEIMKPLGKNPGRINPPWIFALCLILMICLSCAPVGPDYVKPEKGVGNAWNTSLEDGLARRPVDAETLSQWWKRLNDPVLSQLMELSVQGSLDLMEARARVRQARARRGIDRSDLFPSLDLSGSVTKSRGSESTGSGAERKLYSTGFDANWELDIFGGTRRSIEAADAEVEASVHDLQNVLVTLLSEVAINYVEARTFQERIHVAEANIEIQLETLELTRSRFEAGLSDELPVQQSLYNLESTRSQIPTLRAGLEASKNRLAVLIGRPPGAVHEILSEPKPIPVPPVSIAVGVPAETLRNRPDIMLAERRLAAQSARVGEATADLYPRFSLFGSIGLEAVTSSELFNSGSHFWRVGPGISWNVFDAGAIRKNILVQTEIEQQLLAQYESSILLALEEVENAMVAYMEEQIRRESLVIAMEAAQRAVVLSQDRFTAGLVDFNSVLDAQRSLLSFQSQLAQSEGTVTANFVRLYKALGGGWQSMATQVQSG